MGVDYFENIIAILRHLHWSKQIISSIVLSLYVSNHFKGGCLKDDSKSLVESGEYLMTDSLKQIKYCDMTYLGAMKGGALLRNFDTDVAYKDGV